MSGSIRSALIERLNHRIERLRKGQHKLALLNLQDELLNRAINRLTRIRDRAMEAE